MTITETQLNESVTSERESFPLPPTQGTSASAKLAIMIAFSLALAALVAAGALFHAYNVARRDKIAVEAASVQALDQAEALQKEKEQLALDAKRLQEQLRNYSAERTEMISEINSLNIQLEERTGELASLSTATAEGISPEFEMQVIDLQNTVAELEEEIAVFEANSIYTSGGPVVMPTDIFIVNDFFFFCHM